MGVCDCLKHIYDWVYLSKRHLWMSVIVRRLLWIGVTAYSIFMGGCDCLEHFFWVGVGERDWVWMGG